MIKGIAQEHSCFGYPRAIHGCRPWSVTFTSPMNRGLKDQDRPTPSPRDFMLHLLPR